MPGGGLAGQAPWQLQQGQVNNSPAPTQQLIKNSYLQQTQASARMAGQPPKNISMMARITKVPNDTESYKNSYLRITLSTEISALSMIEDKAHIWLVDSAASSHISGNIDLFNNLHSVTPITIETASGESFTADQQGTICITLCSNSIHNLPNIPITLLDVIYVPKLNVNLMSVG